jgi:large subunit ribosomal protein L22
VHCAAHKVGESQGRKPRAMGRASPWNTPEVDVEIVVEEVEA